MTMNIDQTDMNMYSKQYPIHSAIQDQLEDIVLSRDFPWYYIPDATDLSANGNASFVHLLTNEYEVCSPYYNLFESTLACIAWHGGYPLEDIYRARLGLLYPSDVPHNKPHVDYDFMHTVAIYYVNESDGATYFFDDYHEVVHTEQPHKGKTIFFDGQQLHASSTPSKGVRVVLNVNLKSK